MDNSSLQQDDYLANDNLEEDTLTPNLAAIGSSNTITTIAIVSVVIIICIVAVFAIGIFIDCRQEKLNGQKTEESKRKRKRRPISMYRRTRTSTDRRNIIEDAESPGRCRPPLETIVEVV